MAVVILTDKPSKQDIQKAKEEYIDYIKITIDLHQEIVAIGGEYHADAEAVMHEKFGSKNSDLWGGGYRISTKEFSANAMINRKPHLDNNSGEILDPETRNEFLKLAQDIFKDIDSIL